MRRESDHGRERVRERSIVPLLLIVALMFLAFGGGILAWYFVPEPSALFARESAKDGARLVRIAFEDGELSVPEGLLARVDRRTFGPVQQVDLMVPWPYDAKKAPSLGPKQLTDWVLLSFEPDDGGFSPSQRFEKIYVHYFAGPPVSAEGGLVQYDFAPGSPYAGMQLFIDRRADPPVFLRCDMRPSTLGPVLCERRIRVSGRILLRYRFARPLLKRWADVDHQVRTVLEQVWRGTG